LHSADRLQACTSRLTLNQAQPSFALLLRMTTGMADEVRWVALREARLRVSAGSPPRACSAAGPAAATGVPLQSLPSLRLSVSTRSECTLEWSEQRCSHWCDCQPVVCIAQPLESTRPPDALMAATTAAAAAVASTASASASAADSADSFTNRPPVDPAAAIAAALAATSPSDGEAGDGWFARSLSLSGRVRGDPSLRLAGATATRGRGVRLGNGCRGGAAQ